MNLINASPILLAAFFCNQSFAEENTPSKFFVGAELGFAEHLVDFSGADTNYEGESGTSVSPRLAFGYKLNQNWLIVAQYTSYGEADLFDADLDVPVDNVTVPVNIAFSSNTTGLSIAAQWMTERNVGHWSLGAKLGIMRWDTDFDIRFTNTINNFKNVTTESDSGVAIYGGFIGSYAFTEKLDLTLSADWFVNDLDVEIIDGATTDMQYSRASIGFNYHW